MDIKEQYNELKSFDQETFKKAVRTLLQETYIIKDKDSSHDRMYQFIIQKNNETLLSDYLRMVDFDVTVDKELKMVFLRNLSAGNGEETGIQKGRVQFSKHETILLLMLISIFQEKLALSTTSKYIKTSILEINTELDRSSCKRILQDKYNIVGYRNFLKASLKKFKSFNLIDYAGDIFKNASEENQQNIKLYPSLLFGMEINALRDFCDNYIAGYTADNNLTDYAFEEEEDE